MPIRIDPTRIHNRSKPRLQTQDRHVSNATLSLKTLISAGPVRIDPSRIHTRSRRLLQTQGHHHTKCCLHPRVWYPTFWIQMGSRSGPNDHESPEQRNQKKKADTTKVMSAIMSCWTDKSSDVFVHVWIKARDSLVEIFHRH